MDAGVGEGGEIVGELELLGWEVWGGVWELGSGLVDWLLWGGVDGIVVEGLLEDAALHDLMCWIALWRLDVTLLLHYSLDRRLNILLVDLVREMSFWKPGSYW